jgi:hypothetical protein
MVVRNLSTQETLFVGQPRGGAPAWSADSKLVAFESVPAATTSNPPQPITVHSLDGTLDRTLGVSGEVRTAPKFWDADTVASLRRKVGEASGGVDLLFESIKDGTLQRGVRLLPGGADFIRDWDIDPSRTKIVYAVRSATRYTTIELDLQSGQRKEIMIQGDRPKWVP